MNKNIFASEIYHSDCVLIKKIVFTGISTQNLQILFSSEKCQCTLIHSDQVFWMPRFNIGALKAEFSTVQQTFSEHFFAFPTRCIPYKYKHSVRLY
jgi:hypothetical protein